MDDAEDGRGSADAERQSASTETVVKAGLPPRDSQA